MKTTTVSSATRLIGTLAFNAALLLAGVGLTGLAWRALWVVLLPLMVAGAGAGVRFVVLNRMGLPPAATATADSDVEDQVDNNIVAAQRY
jgi:hypothetical protein